MADRRCCLCNLIGSRYIMSKGWLPCDARSAGSNASSTGSGFGLRLVDHRRKHRDLQSWWTQGASPRAR
uniref:Uncharacterized protein n=1 Tax=Coccidioides posadasii RMSCC 3488 TaxID=454284 RepID=A0A0J6FHP8_COCPO|nr:hypothetical protein CPAG_04678 [Coccidioides posadasii RMSCC 3488]